jgi:hypothetical protein
VPTAKSCEAQGVYRDAVQEPFFLNTDGFKINSNLNIPFSFDVKPCRLEKCDRSFRGS